MKNILINSASMKKAALSLAILVSFCLIFAVSCGSNVQAPSGALPTWKVGDTWTIKLSHNGFESIEIYTVTGEQVVNGIDCYTIIAQSPSTTIGTTATTIQEADKTTLKVISLSINETIFSVTTNISYDYSVQPYPLSVGKTWIGTINTTSTTQTTKQNQTISEIQNYTYKVEKVESITVPAGTFKCFKIVEYDDNNSIVSTSWVSDVTRGYIVKEINNVYGTTFELISYSLSE